MTDATPTTTQPTALAALDTSDDATSPPQSAKELSDAVEDLVLAYASQAKDAVLDGLARGLMAVGGVGGARPRQPGQANVPEEATRPRPQTQRGARTARITVHDVARCVASLPGNSSMFYANELAIGWASASRWLRRAINCGLVRAMGQWRYRVYVPAHRLGKSVSAEAMVVAQIVRDRPGTAYSEIASQFSCSRDYARWFVFEAIDRDLVEVRGTKSAARYFPTSKES